MSAKVTPEVLDMMVELLPTVGSLRDLCAITGLQLEVVRKATAPFRALMKLQGTHPKCGCGRDRFHPYGCTDSFPKGKHSGLVPGRTLEEARPLLERRAMIIELLVAGDRFTDIDRALGMGKGYARKYLRFLSAGQMAERERAIAARGPIPCSGRPPALTRNAAPLVRNDRRHPQSQEALGAHQ